MSETTLQRTRAAHLVISESQLPLLEELATGHAARNPDLAERLLSKLARARIVAPAKLPSDIVALGRRATYLESGGEAEKDVTLVLPAEADIACGHISVLTPIGVALIGLPAGARAQWETRNGETRQLLLQSVAPGPADPGDPRQ